MFSLASIWEVTIRIALGRSDFRVDPRHLRHALLRVGYQELGIGGLHATAADALPPLQKDPFDRILIAQALVEDVTLLTSDPIVGQYPGHVLLVG